MTETLLIAILWMLVYQMTNNALIAFATIILLIIVDSIGKGIALGIKASLEEDKNKKEEEN